MENSRTCEICGVNVPRASYAKHLRSKKHLETKKQDEIIIPDRLFIEEQALIKKKLEKVYEPKTLKQIAGENSKINDTELEKELAKVIILIIQIRS